MALHGRGERGGTAAEEPVCTCTPNGLSLADRVGQRLLRERGDSENLATHPARLMGALASVYASVIAEGDSAATERHVRDMLSTRNVDADLALAHANNREHLKRAGNLFRVPGGAWIEDEVTRAHLA